MAKNKTTKKTADAVQTTLDAMVANLQTLINRQAAKSSGDAIDAELSKPGRKTDVVSLKDAPEVEAFRNELSDGLIRVDTAHQLLTLVNTLVTKFIAM